MKSRADRGVFKIAGRSSLELRSVLDAASMLLLGSEILQFPQNDIIMFLMRPGLKVMEVQPREIERYTTSDGRVPFDRWFYSLRALNAKLKIQGRIDRVQDGNLGDSRSVGEVVCEFRINYGPGYRVYFGQVGATIMKYHNQGSYVEVI